MHLRAQAKLAFVFMLSEKNHMSIIFFFLKPALHVNHSLLVAITVKGLRLRAQRQQVEKMEMRGHEDEDGLSLFQSHSHRHSRRLERSNQEAGHWSF